MKHANCTVLVLALLAFAGSGTQILAQSTYTPYTFTNFAGMPAVSGSADGTGSAARFNSPFGAAMDSTGNVYVGDNGNHTIRKVTPGRVVTTLAGLAGISGSADGTGSAARFYKPAGVAVDSAGNVYVADYFNNTIRKVTPAGVVMTLAGLAGNAGSADGTGSAARFYAPVNVAVDSAGNVYVADQFNHTIRTITPAGVVATLAGQVGNAGSADGTGSGAQFYHPSGVAVDSMGSVYVGDQFNYTIRKITAAGVVTTLAGLAVNAGTADGTGSAARFDHPSGLAVDSAGNVYVADTWNDRITKGTPSTPMQANINGFGGNGTGWTTNGVATVSTNVLQVTDGRSYQTGSAFYNIPQNITAFTVSFTYQSKHLDGGQVGDGMVFVLQNQGPAALGGGYGYQGISNATGVAFNLFTGSGAVRGTGYAPTAVPTGIYQSVAPVDLLDTIDATLTYDGTTLTESLVDTATGGTFTTHYVVDLLAAVGGSTAYVGFGGSCGAAAQQQQISNFQFQASLRGLAPVIVAEPQSQSVPAGSNALFTVFATGLLPLSYQWSFMGASIPGATNSTLILTNVELGDMGAYAVTVMNSAGSVVSLSATLTVLAPAEIVTQPASEVGSWGGDIFFRVEATGTPPLAYQWYFDGVPIPAGTNFSGTGSTLTLKNLELTAAGQYWVVVTNNYGSATSSVANLVVNPAGISIGLYAGVTINGAIGKTFGIQYTTDLSTPNWTTAATVTLTNSVQLWVDTSVNVSGGTRRFYRVVALP